MPKRLTISEAQQTLMQLPNELTDEPVIITRDGEPVMAAMSYEHLTSLLETVDILSDAEFVEKLRQSIAQSNTGETISWDDAKHVRLNLTDSQKLSTPRLRQYIQPYC